MHLRVSLSAGVLAFQIFFLTASVLGQDAPHTQSTIEALASRAQDAQGRGDYQSAAESYREILKLRPHWAEARANLGLMQHLMGKEREAIQSFEAALRVNPELFVPNLFLGLDLLGLREPRRALPYLERAQRLNPHDEQAALGLARAYEALREFEKAISGYDRAALLNPRNADSWYGLGVRYLNQQEAAIERLGKIGLDSVYFKALLADSFEQQEHPEGAVKIYRELLKSSPPLTCLRAALGFALIRQGHAQEAEEEFKQELKDNPGCLADRLGLARISVERGDIATALKELDEAWTGDSDFVQANASRVWLGLEPQKIDEFETELRQLAPAQSDDGKAGLLIHAIEKWRENPAEVPVEPGDPSSRDRQDAKSSQGETGRVSAEPERLFSQGHYARCAQALKPGLGSLPATDLLLLAQCAFYAGDYRGSFAASGKLLQTAPQDLSGLYWRARASEKLAVAALVRAGLAEPDSGRVHLLLGEIYRDKHNFKEAEAEYRKAISLKPGELAAHLGLATTYYRAFKFDLAIPEIQKALEISPGDPEANYLMGDILVYRHEYSEAMRYVRAALQGTPSSVPRVHALIGKIYASEGRLTDAVSELKQSLPGDRDGSFHFQLHRLYQKLGKEEAADAALKESETIRKNALARQRSLLEISP